MRAKNLPVERIVFFLNLIAHSLPIVVNQVRIISLIDLKRIMDLC